MPRYRARLTRHSTSGNAVHDFSFPFRRYVPLVKHAKTLGREFQIINVVTGKAVNLETFSFADHVETLALAARMVRVRTAHHSTISTCSVILLQDDNNRAFETMAELSHSRSVAHTDP